MNNAAIFVSNDPKNPGNTASDFRVTYNSPVDMTGKQMALTSVTLTKSQPNVVDETVELFVASEELVDRVDTLVHLMQSDVEEDQLTPLSNPLFASRFIGGYKKAILKDSGERTLVTAEVKLYGGGRFGRFEVSNESTEQEAVISLNMYARRARGWTIYRIGGDLVQMDGPRWVPQSDRVASQPSAFKLAGGKKGTILFGFHKTTGDKGLTLENPEDDLAAYMWLDELKNNTEFRIAINSNTKVKKQKVTKTVAKPGPAYFDSVTDLTANLNRNAAFSALAKLQYATESRKIVLTLKPKVTIKLGGLQHHLGFDRDILVNDSESPTAEKTFEADRMPDMTRGTHNFFIYCSLTDPVMVNDKRLNLLATVDATKGGYGEQVRHNVTHPIFVDCVAGLHQNVHITIADDVGNYSNLLMGRTILTCAVRNA